MEESNKVESNKAEKPKKEPNYLTQILVNVTVLGIFLLVETWLLFFMLSDSFVLPMIFGILIILAGCLLTINVYQFFNVKLSTGKDQTEDKKFQLYVVRKLKQLEAGMMNQDNQSMGEQQETALKQMEESLKKNDLLASKAVIKKMEEMISEIKPPEIDFTEIISKMDDQKELISKLNKEAEEMEDSESTMLKMLSQLEVSGKNTDKIIVYLQEQSRLMEEELQTIKELINNKSNLTQEPSFVQDNVEEEPVILEEDNPFVLNDEVATTEEIEPDEVTNNDVIGNEQQENEIMDDSADEESEDNTKVEIPDVNDPTYDPNKQLTPEEIAAMFASIT